MTPFEFGSWIGTKGSATGFAPMEYLGTKVHNGQVSNSSSCVVGFDRARFVASKLGFSRPRLTFHSYILGLAASAFNFYTIEADSNGTLAQFPKRSEQSAHQLQKRADFPATTVNSIYAAFKQYFNLTESETALATIPNPYAGLPGMNGAIEPNALTLVDGSESGQSIPYWPLIQPARNVDFM